MTANSNPFRAKFRQMHAYRRQKPAANHFSCFSTSRNCSQSLFLFQYEQKLQPITFPVSVRAGTAANHFPCFSTSRNCRQSLFLFQYEQELQPITFPVSVRAETAANHFSCLLADLGVFLVKLETFLGDSLRSEDISGYAALKRLELLENVDFIKCYFNPPKLLTVSHCLLVTA